MGNFGLNFSVPQFPHLLNGDITTSQGCCENKLIDVPDTMIIHDTMVNVS